MATSENQGMKISLILFVSLTILMSIFTFWFFSSWQEADEQATKNAADGQTARSALQKSEADMETIKQLMGIDATATVADVQQAYEADMAAYAATIPEEQRNYRQALQLLGESHRTVSEELVDEKNTKEELNQAFDNSEAAKQSQIDQFRQEAEKASQDLAIVKQEAAEERDRLEREKAELQAKSERFAEELRTTQEERDLRISDLDAEIAEKDQLLAEARTKITELESQNYEVADGEIRHVNATAGTVWINLGEADGLRRQVTFSVFGPDANNYEKIVRKGAIEVTKLIGAHLAEAIITEDELIDPIIPGDQVYTPLWQPGRRPRFALAGWMDLDGDELSDRERIRNLVAMSGGILDAELSDTGEESGELTLDTRYLVSGESKPEIQRQLEMWEAKADDLGIERLSLDKFLEFIGWTDPEKSYRYESGGASNPRASGSGGDNRFQPRRPAGRNGGAYFRTGS